MKVHSIAARLGLGLGTIFGAIFLSVFLAIGVPWASFLWGK